MPTTPDSPSLRGIAIPGIIWSQICFQFFRFGPLEWAWRSLTNWMATDEENASPKCQY